VFQEGQPYFRKEQCGWFKEFPDRKVKQDDEDWICQNKMKGSNPARPAILQTVERPESRTQITQNSRDKAEDRNAPKPLQWTDMVMNNWRKACKTEGREIDPSELKYMARDNIELGMPPRLGMQWIRLPRSSAQMGRRGDCDADIPERQHGQRARGLRADRWHTA
jgi:hypothetical protein